MFKVNLVVVFLVGALVNPCHSCKPVSFFKEVNENYQLFERAKAAAGRKALLLGALLQYLIIRYCTVLC